MCRMISLVIAGLLLVSCTGWAQDDGLIRSPDGPEAVNIFFAEEVLQHANLFSFKTVCFEMFHVPIILMPNRRCCFLVIGIVTRYDIQ